MTGSPAQIRFEMLAVAVFAAIGFACVMYSTSRSIGLTPDSASYIAAARNFVSGEGLTIFVDGQQVPLTHYPPLLPLLLAVPGAFGIDPMIGVRWLNALSFAGAIVFAGYFARLLVPGSVLANLFACCLILTSITLHQIYAMAWSEPVFILITLAGLTTFARYFEHRERSVLIVAAVFAGLALLTRYLGIVLIFVCILTMIFSSRRALRDKMIEVVIFGVISCGPLFLWLNRNLLQGDTLANREIAVHLVTLEKLRHGLVAISHWFIPGRFASPEVGLLVLLSLFLLAYYMIVKYRNDFRHDNGTVLRMSSVALLSTVALYVVCYPTLVMISISFFDIHTPLDDRILSPVYVLLMIFVASTTAYLMHHCRPKWLATSIASTVFAAMLGLHLARTPAWIVSASDSSLEYGSTRWRQSPTIAFLEKLPADSVIYTNGPGVIYVRANRVVKRLPLSTDAATLQPNENYQEALMDMARSLRQNDGYLVYFHGIHPPFLPYLAEFWDKLPFDLVYEADDGVVAKIRK